MMKGMVLGIAGAFALALSGAAQAQVRTMDPNEANDLAPVPASESNYGTNVTATPERSEETDPTMINPSARDAQVAPADDVTVKGSTMPTRSQAADASAGATYEQDDVLAAAEGTFGKGAEGLAKLIEKIFAEQGKPNAYIAGREAGGAIVLGVRYGSGTMFHKVEGQLPIYWTGPSVGFDLGANGAKSFVLVYNQSEPPS